MADFFVDHGAYASNLGAAPTWGVPQEGDGSATAAASTAGTAAIVFSANCAAGASFTVCGIVFTAVASGASGNQFNVGAALTNTIDNLVAAINASTSFVGVGVALGNAQLRNFVFARNTGGTTLDVMMRVGSAALNGANNSSCQMTASSWSASTSLPVLFAGGSGGCFGWLFNTTAIGVGSYFAALSYGVMVMPTPTVCVSSANLNAQAAPTASDTIWARTGAGFTLTCASNTCPNIGAPSYSHNLVFDSNVQWTGDSGTGVVTVSLSMTNTDAVIWPLLATGSTLRSIRCIHKGGLRFLWTSTGATGLYIRPYSNSGSRAGGLLDGVVFEESSGTNSGSKIQISASGNYSGLRMKNCDFKLPAARTSWGGIVSASSLDGALILEGCSVATNHTGGADPGPILVTGISAGGSLKLIGCSFSGWSFGKYRVSDPKTFGAGAELIVEACTGLALGTSYLNLSALDYANPNYYTYTYTSADPGLGFRFENRAGVVDWNPDAAPAYPYRSALLMDGTTGWSIKFDWFSATVNCFSNLESPRLSTMVRLSSAARTLTLDFMSPVSVSARDVAMRVSYIGTDNIVYTESTWGVASALTQPGATWTNAGSFPSHVSNRLTLTTSRSVKQGTEIAAYLELTGAPPGGSGIQLYVDPELGVS